MSCRWTTHIEWNMTTIQLVKLLLQVWLSSWKFMRDSNSSSIGHLADFTPADWTSSLNLSKGVGSPQRTLLEVKNVASRWTFHFTRPKWKHLARKPTKHYPILNFVSSQVLILNQVWKDSGFYVVLQFSRTEKPLQPEEQSSGLDNQVICSTMSGCYLYLFGVE